MQQLNLILEKDEKILWEGRPELLPFIFNIGTLISAVGIPIAISQSSNTSGLNILVILVLLALPVYQLLVHGHTCYAITNKRVILQGGLIGRDFQTIDFDKITNAEVDVGIFDKLIGGGSGSILLFSGKIMRQSEGMVTEVPYRLSNISNPYEIFKYFKKVSYDIKTDIEYPNALRPENNPGYKTEYSTEHLEKDN